VYTDIIVWTRTFRPIEYLLLNLDHWIA